MPEDRSFGDVEPSLFDEVADAVLGLVPSSLGPLRYRARRYGIKVWFDAAEPPREHYEAQVLSAKLTPDASVLGLEIGFHAENPDVALNEAVVEQLVGRESRWRKTLGLEAVVGPFLGRPEDWRRVSETWADPDLSDPELPLEVAARLTDYITALEPVRRG